MQNLLLLSMHVLFSINFCEISKESVLEDRIAAAIAYDKDSLQFSLLCFLSLSSRRALISVVFFCLSTLKLEDEYGLSGNRSQCSLVGIASEFANSVFAVPSVEGELWEEILDNSSPMKTLAWKQSKRCVFDKTKMEHLEKALVGKGFNLRPVY